MKGAWKFVGKNSNFGFEMVKLIGLNKTEQNSNKKLKLGREESVNTHFNMG